MRAIPRPATNLSEHFRKCAGATRDTHLRDRLLASENAVLQDAAAFDTAGETSSFFQLRNSPASTASDDELRSLYSRAMARTGSVGRALYDSLKHAAPRGICPLCNQRPVASLDHYLPKDHYPKLAVAPTNLVPCCLDCNHLKQSFTPQTADDQLFHPYFDNNGDDHWLQASISYASGAPVVEFRAQPPGNWNASRSARLVHHFTKLRLSTLYSIYGTAEIEVVRPAIMRILATGSAHNVSEHLRDCWLDRQAADRNSWQATTYAALHVDPIICSGRF